MDNINILVEAKKEYTNQLQKILRPRIYEGFKSIYEDIIDLSSKELEEKKIQNHSIIKTFQKTLREIPQWNQDMIKNEYVRIEKISNCDYFEDLIEAVFITNTKILTSVQINNKKSLNIKINIPQSPYFIHKCYMKCAIELYKNPYIFDQSKGITPKEKHNNLREALNLIDNCINNAISDLLPIRDILKQGLTKNKQIEEEIMEEEEIIEDEEDDEEESKEEIHENELIDQNEIEKIIVVDIDKKSIDVIDVKNYENDVKNEEDDDDNNDDENNDDDNYDDDENNDDDEDKVIDLKKEKIIDLKKENEIIDFKKEDIKFIDLKKNDMNSTNEFRKIVYNKVVPTFASKIKNVLKIDLNDNEENDNEENDIDLNNEEHNIELNNEEHNILDLDKEKPKLDNEKTIVNKEKQINPFIKNIKNTKFIKNKFNSSDRTNTFYKKKYEENSANYNSISDSLKDNVPNTENSSKITKNKIMLNDASSDEDDNMELDL